MSSASAEPSPPPSTPERGRSSEVPDNGDLREQQELEDMMRTPTLDSPLSRTLGSSSPSNGDELPQLDTEASASAPLSRSSLRVESERARRLAVLRKLTPYQRDLVDEYIKLPPLSRSVTLYIQQCELLNKIEAIIVTSCAFVVSEPLAENIKGFVMAVLLSSKLTTYRTFVPRDHVMALVRREGLHLPDNYENDTHIVRTIANAVSEELTQCRSRVKKELRTSIKNSATVYDLASTLTLHTRCVVTPALCARLAFLRAMYAKDPSPNGFWTGVDNQLSRIRTAAGDNAVKITRAFTVYLNKDRTTFGGSAEDAPSLSPLAATWQESVDGIVEGN